MVIPEPDDDISDEDFTAIDPSSPSAGQPLSAEQRVRSRRDERSRSRERMVKHRVGSFWRLNALKIFNSATIASRIFRFRARRGRKFQTGRPAHHSDRLPAMRRVFGQVPPNPDSLPGELVQAVAMGITCFPVASVLSDLTGLVIVFVVVRVGG